VYVNLEYDLGLFTNDRKLKPIGKTIRKLIDQGTRPAVVLQSKTSDAEYLKARGIEQLITLDQV
jgi:hypothetical protein